MKATQRRTDPERQRSRANDVGANDDGAVPANATGLLAAIVEGSEDAIISKTLEGVITSWNAGAERMFGYTAAEAIGRPVSMLVPEDRLEEEQQILARLARGERIQHFETVRRAKDGRLLEISLAVSPVRDRAGRIVGASKIARDISGTKRADAALRASERRYRHLIQSLPEAVYTCDEQGYVTLYNDAAAELWGRVPEIGVDRWCGSLRAFWRDGSEMPLADCPMAEALREGRPGRGEEIVIERPDGTRRNVLVHPVPVLDEAGRVSGAVSILVDITSIRAAESALRDSRERLALSAEIAELGAWEFGVAPGAGRWDARCRQHFGAAGGGTFRYEEVLGAVHADDRPRFEAAVRRALGPGGDGAWRIEHRTIGIDDGVERWIRTSGRAVFEDGAPVRFLGATQDVTRRRRSEEALRDSEERFRTLADHISQLAWMADERGWIFWYNRRWLDYTGATLKEMQGSGWVKVHHPEHAERVVRKYREAFEAGHTWEDTFPLRSRTGEYRWFLSRAVPIRDAEGRIFRWFGTNTDITELREAEAAMRESEARFRTMADSAPVLIWMSDPQGRATWFNRPWLEFTGRGLGEELGDGWTTGLHPDDTERCRRLMGGASERASGSRLTFRLRRWDGEHRWLLSQGVPLRRPHGGMTGYIGSCIDVTDEVAARTALERQQAALGEAVRQRTEELEESHRRLRISERMASIGTLSAGLGHDLANILLPIRLRLDALDRVLEREDVREELREIRSSIEYLQELSGGLRMLVVDPNEKPSDARTELRAWWAHASAVIRSAVPPGVTLTCRLPEGECWIRFSATSLTQATFNLVQNAIDALRPRGSGAVRIGADREGDVVVVWVSDDGPGMTPEVRERCTHPFFTTKARRMSTGLGLALVYGMVREAGGTLEVESEAGRGTTVRMRLKAAVPVPLRGAAGRTASVGVSDPRLRAIVRAELQDLGFKVETEPTSCAASLRVVDREPERDGAEGGEHVLVVGGTERGSPFAGITDLRCKIRAAAASAAADGVPEPPSRPDPASQ